MIQSLMIRLDLFCGSPWDVLDPITSLNSALGCNKIQNIPRVPTKKYNSPVRVVTYSGISVRTKGLFQRKKFVKCAGFKEHKNWYGLSTVINKQADSVNLG